MVRKLKHHEQKLLKKVDLYTYPSDPSHREHTIRRRYHLTHPQDYHSYNALAGQLRQLAHRLSLLDASDPFRVRHERLLLEKLFDVGLIKRKRGGGGAATAAPTSTSTTSTTTSTSATTATTAAAGGGGGGGLSQVEREVGVSAFARRRLPVVMVRIGMVETLKAAVTFVEQGHVRVGTEAVTDPAFLVTRNLEDFVTWVDGSKVKRQVMEYRHKLDDFELM